VAFPSSLVETESLSIYVFTTVINDLLRNDIILFSRYFCCARADIKQTDVGSVAAEEGI